MLGLHQDVVLHSFQTHPGSISDKEIVVKSGFLNPNLWEQGDIVMADRGFLIKDYLKPLGVGLEIPNFLKGRDQFTINETVKSQQIANERIHVKRMIQRLKCYHIFDRVLPVNGRIIESDSICMCFAFQSSRTNIEESIFQILHTNHNFLVYMKNLCFLYSLKL